MAVKILNALIAIAGGIGGAMVIFWILNKLAESLKGKWEDRVKPWAFAGPAILAIAVYLIYPAVVTIQYSFANADSTAYVGFKNYKDILTDSTFLQVLFNNLLWIIIVPAMVVILGLGVATLADRMQPRGEKLSKTVIFLPMAISMVGAATIWRSIYDYQPKGTPQTGLLNAFMELFGRDPVYWYGTSKLHFNSLLLMIIFIWTQVGYAMVLLSAAIKSVPEDTIEAGPGLGHRADRLHHRPHRRHEDLRHRVCHDQWWVQHRRHRPPLLLRDVHRQQQRLCGRHRRAPHDRDHPGPDLPGAPLQG